MEPQAAAAAGTAQLPGLLAQQPTTLHMVMEALRAQDERKGASVAAIKKFILAKYPSVDPVRLKYLLKQALSKGLSRGDLVRPHNSNAVGATGRFKLAPKKLRQKQPPGKAGSDGEQPLKAGRKGTTKPPQAPAAGARQRGAAEEQSTAAKQKQKLKPVDVQPPAAAKPSSDGVKPLQAAGRPRAPGKVRSKAPAAENAGGGDDYNPAGARANGARKVPAGKSKEKVPKEEQQDGPKVKGKQKVPAGKSKEKVPKEEQQDGPKVKGKQKVPAGKSKEKVPKEEQQDGPKVKGEQKVPAGKSKEKVPKEEQQDGPKVKGEQKVPAGKSKEKAPKEAQQDGPKVKGAKGKARKPRVPAAGGQGEARPQEAAPCPADKEDL